VIDTEIMETFSYAVVGLSIFVVVGLLTGASAFAGITLGEVMQACCNTMERVMRNVREDS
jgi:hypothetical protein